MKTNDTQTYRCNETRIYREIYSYKHHIEEEERSQVGKPKLPP